MLPAADAGPAYCCRPIHTLEVEGGVPGFEGFPHPSESVAIGLLGRRWTFATRGHQDYQQDLCPGSSNLLSSDDKAARLKEV